MSIQDDIFDVQAALEEKPEAEAFERIYELFAHYEEENLNLSYKLKSIRTGIACLKDLFNV